MGAGFGLVFVLVNAGAQPHPVGAVLRFLGVAAFVAVLIALRRPAHMSTPGGSAGNGVGRGYWLVVAGSAAVTAAMGSAWQPVASAERRRTSSSSKRLGRG